MTIKLLRTAGEADSPDDKIEAPPVPPEAERRAAALYHLARYKAHSARDMVTEARGEVEQLPKRLGSWRFDTVVMGLLAIATTGVALGFATPPAYSGVCFLTALVSSAVLLALVFYRHFAERALKRGVQRVIALLEAAEERLRELTGD